MAKFKSSTMLAGAANDIPEGPELPQDQPTDSIEVANEPKPVIKDEAKPIAEKAVANEVKETPANGDINFDLGEPVTVDTPVTDWRQGLKTADKAEVLKELGLDWALALDDFDKEFSTFRKNGGDPYQYLQAKSVDFTKISDDEILKNNFDKKFPNLNPEQRNFLFNKQYGINELDEDDEKQMKEIQKQADAYTVRQQLIEEQKKFNIPAATQQQVTKESIIKELSESQFAEAEQIRKSVLEHPAIKNLMDSKRVAIEAGEFGKFNFGITDPKVIVDFMNDGNTYRKYTSNEKGELDMDKAVLSALLNVVGVKRFTSTLINYGKQMSTKQLVEEGRNAEKTPAPAAQHQEKQSWRTGRGIV